MGVNPATQFYLISNGDPGRKLDSQNYPTKVFFSVGIKTGKQVDRNMRVPPKSTGYKPTSWTVCDGRWILGSNPTSLAGGMLVRGTGGRH